MSPAQEKALLRLYGLSSLGEATRDNWPWWDANMRTGNIDPVFPPLDREGDRADAAAVKVLARINADSTYPLLIEPPFWADGKGHDWLIHYGEFPDRAGLEGKTLGQLALAALEVQP